MSPADQIFYAYLQKHKEASKAIEACKDKAKNDKQSAQNVVQVSKKLTENAYFDEAKALITLVRCQILIFRQLRK